MAKRCRPPDNRNEEVSSDWLRYEGNYLENLVEDGSTASSVNIDSDIDDDNTEAGSMFGDEDDMTLGSEPTETVKKKCQQLKKCINIKDADVVKFISNRSKYSQELSNKLEKLNAEVELVPEKNHIIVTKKPRSRYMKDWKKRCCSIVKNFCSRFRKNCFELKDSSSVQKAWLRLGKMLQWSNSMYWIESNKILAVMTEQSECEQVLKKVKEFLENDGIQEYRSDEDERKKPSNVTKVAGKKNSLKQRQKSVNIDSDIANFLLKRGKCSDDLKGQLSCLGAELQILKSGVIKIKEVNGNTVPNWEEKCVKAVNVFSGRFHKKYFLLENEIRDSIPEALSTLQKDVSCTGGACWLDKHKQKLILVSPKDEFTHAEKEVEKFIENVRRFAQKSFKIEESIHELVRKDLPTLKEALKSCNIALKKKMLVVVCLRNEVDNVAEKVEGFLQKLQGVKQNDAERKVEYSKQIKNQNKDKILLKAVNNPEFIPRSYQEPVRNFALTPPTSPISPTSTAIGPRILPVKCFFRREETPAEERLNAIENFVNQKITQLAEDPALLDELSVFMANYLSACITVENEVIKVSDILFERCVSEQNIQYTGSKLANYLDKFLVPKTTEQLAFRKAFLNRCSSENARFIEVIHSNPERACNFAIFFGELVMNYKTVDGQTITKFLSVVSSIILQLLQFHDKKLLICAGKLLKLTGSSLDQNDKMFVTIAQKASDPRMDKAVQILFSRVSELRRTSWGHHETLRSTAYLQPNVCGAQVFAQNMNSMLEEQASDLPVLVEDEWSGYVSDSSGQDEFAFQRSEMKLINELNEDFYRRMCLEQYGHYVPYATEDNWSNTRNDDYDADFEDFLKGQQQQYLPESFKDEKKKPKEVVEVFKTSCDHADYIERIQFLNTLKQCHPGMVEAFMTKAKNKICLKGSNEAILVAKQQYEDLVKELNVIELPTEVKHFVSQKEGLEFINNRLSNNESVYVIVVGAAKVKVVAQSPQVCEEVRECLCKNVRKATINLPPESEHIFASKQWYEISKTIETERLVDYQVNFVHQRRHDIKLYGVSHLVKKHEKIITDFIKSQKIECYTIYLLSGTARFMKEKLSEEIAKIESDLKEEQVKINILLEKRTCECKGTKEGILESKRRVLALSNEITPKSKDYPRIGICTLFFGENGKRNIKGIEAGSNAIIELSKEPSSMEKETTQAEVDAIQTERAQGKSKIRQAPSMDPFDQCNFTTKEGLKISWKYGNIAQERADILVSSAVRDLSNPAMVGRVMNSVGGPSFVAACCQHTNIGTGDIATTIGGNLLCQYVIHAVCCDWNSNGVGEQTLRRLLLKILLECTQLSASSVAMPLIGTGKRGFREDFVLRVMREEFERFSSMYPSRTLKEIRLIRYDPSGRQTTVQAPPVSGSTYQIAPASNASSNPFVRLVAGSSAETVKLQVFARTSIDISSAFDEIEKFIQNHLISKTLNHEKHYDVVLKHWDELKRLTKDRDLKITCLDPTTVLMEGVLSKVVEAKDKLAELVSQYTSEERKSNQLSYTSQNVQWYYCDKKSREVPYSAQLNVTIELARMKGEATVEITEQDGQKYVVNFSEMVAKNASSTSFLQGILASYFPTKSGQTKKLIRKLISSAASPGSELFLPSNWTPQPENQLVQMVQIASSSQEYMEVQNHFVARGGNASRLYKVERIQNPQLFSRYLAFKKSMRGQVSEMRLFHGTDAANVDSINAHNFSRSFAGVNGVAYGHGVYFARDASYSMSYASRQLSGSLPKMYMAKVLVGDYTRGAKGMKAPPLKNDPNNPGLRYDSVVDHPSNPSMYIIFQDNQYYPEYLLTMR